MFANNNYDNYDNYDNRNNLPNINGPGYDNNELKKPINDIENDNNADVDKNDNKYESKTTTLKILIKSDGDLLTKEYDLIPFHPNMLDITDLSNNRNVIFFPSFVKITMNDLKNANLGIGSDYYKAFTNLNKYTQLIKYIYRSR